MESVAKQQQEIDNVASVASDRNGGKFHFRRRSVAASFAYGDPLGSLPPQEHVAKNPVKLGKTQ